jgi:hypothetical protein
LNTSVVTLVVLIKVTLGAHFWLSAI